jgi:hypothetical protein
LSGRRTIVAGGTLATDYGVFTADVVRSSRGHPRATS